MRESVEQIFVEASRMAGRARADVVERMCAGDAGLRAEVESLLEAYDAAGSFLGGDGGEEFTSSADTRTDAYGGAAATQSASRIPIEREGDVIDRYTLVERIGEGGFGTVWLAEQRQPVKRRVALKIIKLGMDTKQVIARFEAERQALALMDHPHIAKVFDAGATNTGRPYFVMELVRGQSITDYCAREKLDTRARLLLFEKVCNALQHAHQKGIIHRDIKPSNVLVDASEGEASPKVIDFGIAKATSFELTERTLVTGHRQLMGTPAYMSPEQTDFVGIDVDTRSDVYSLGVLLYELLTGSTPFEQSRFRGVGPADIQRIIRDEEPMRPSIRLASATTSSASNSAMATDPAHPVISDKSSAMYVAQLQRTDARTLLRRLRGDLDWITMKCLEKDRAQRYETANELAADIRRHLNDEPVIACPPRTFYRVRKFMRRHRASAMAAGLVLCVLVVASAISVTFGIKAERARSAMNVAQDALMDSLAKERDASTALGAANQELATQRDEAQRQERYTREVLDYVTDDLVAAVHPDQLGREATLHEWLDAASRSLGIGSDSDGVQFPVEPEVRLALDRAVGTAYLKLDYFDEAKQHLQRALADATELYGDAHLETLYIMEPLVQVHFQMLEIEPADALVDEAMKLCRAHHPEKIALLVDLLNDRGMIDFFQYDRQGQRARIDDMLASHTEAVALAEQIDDPGRLVLSLKYLARVQFYTGEREESFDVAQRAYDVALDAFGPKHVYTLEAMHELALAHSRLGRSAAGIPILKRLAPLARDVLGAHSLLYLMVTYDIAMQEHWMGDPESALTSFDSAIQDRVSALGPDHTWTLGARMQRAFALRSLGRHEEARTEFEAVCARARIVYGDEHGFTAEAAGNTAMTLSDLGLDAEALPYHELCLRATKSAIPYSGLVGARTLALVNCLERLGRRREAIDVLRETLGDDPSILETRLDLRRTARSLVTHLHELADASAEREAMGWEHALGSWANLLERDDVSATELADVVRELFAAAPESVRDSAVTGDMIERVLAGSDGRVELLEALATALESTGDEEHEFAIRRRLVEHPKAQAHHLRDFSKRLREAPARWRDLPESLRLAERAVEMNDAPWMMHELAQAQLANGMSAEAIETWRQAVAKPNAPQWLIEHFAWRLLAAQPLEQRRPIEALENASRAIEMHPGDPSVYMLKSLALAQLANDLNDDAADTWEQVAARAAEDSEAVLHEAWSLVTNPYEQLRNDAVALRLARSAVAARDNPPVKYLQVLGTCQLAAAPDEAAATWQQILDHPSATPGQLNETAWQLLTNTPEHLRDTHAARMLAQAAKERTSDQDEWYCAYLDTLALAMFREGDTAQALELERQASVLAGREGSFCAEHAEEFKQRITEFQDAMARPAAPRTHTEAE